MMRQLMDAESYLGGDTVLLMTEFTFLINHPSQGYTPSDFG